MPCIQIERDIQKVKHFSVKFNWGQEYKKQILFIFTVELFCRKTDSLDNILLLYMSIIDEMYKLICFVFFLKKIKVEFPIRLTEFSFFFD